MYEEILYGDEHQCPECNGEGNFRADYGTHSTWKCIECGESWQVMAADEEFEAPEIEVHDWTDI